MSRTSVQANHSQHYVYKTTHCSGLYYIGVHSADDARNNKYLGSGKRLQEAFKQFPRKEWQKEVIEIFDRRIEAECLEGKMVTERELADEKCLNSIKGISR